MSKEPMTITRALNLLVSLAKEEAINATNKDWRLELNEAITVAQGFVKERQAPPKIRLTYRAKKTDVAGQTLDKAGLKY